MDGEEGVGLERLPELPTGLGDVESGFRGGGPAPKAAIFCVLPALRPAEQHVLEELERQAVLVYTPSRKVNGKRVVCYDDRYIVKVAYEQDGVIVSNDNYRDLQSENPEWKWFIEQRLLMFSFVNDRYVVACGVLVQGAGVTGRKSHSNQCMPSGACSHRHTTPKQRTPKARGNCTP